MKVLTVRATTPEMWTTSSLQPTVVVKIDDHTMIMKMWTLATLSVVMKLRTPIRITLSAILPLL